MEPQEQDPALNNAAEAGAGAQQTPSPGPTAGESFDIELPQWLEDLLEPLEGQPLLQSLAIVVLAFVVGKLLDFVFRATLSRWARRSETDLDDKILRLLRRAIVRSVVLLGFVVAIRRLPVSDGGKATSINFVLSVLVIVLSFAAFRLASLLLRTASTKETIPMVEERTFPLFDNLAKVGVVAIAIYFAITIWNFDATGWIASAGIAGIAIGFAAQDTLSNLFAGLFIIGDAPYRVGDWIVLDSAERGMVTNIGLRSTRILTRDDVEVTIPNKVIGNAKITNESGGPHPKYRIRLQVGVAYGTDIDRMRKVLLEVANGCPKVCRTPAARVRMRAFGDSSLDFELLCWVDNPVLRGQVLDILYTSIYQRFEKENITIPFPQRDLWVKQMAAGPVS